MSVKIFDNNYLDPDLIANEDFSSEQASFPAANALNLERRSKTWRTGGHWEITASNNTLRFFDQLGVPLDAVVPVGKYTSTTSFLSALETAMDSVGVANHTVEIDSTTSKVRISSDLSGGATLFAIVWPVSTIGDVLGFDPSTNDSGASSYLADFLRIHTDEYYEFDFGIETLPTAFALVGPRNEPIKISPNATIKIQGNETNDWTSPSADITVNYDPETLCAVNADGLWPTGGLRYARLQIIDKDNPVGFVEVGALFLGTYFEGTRGKVQFPLRADKVDRSRTVTSEGGQTYSDIRQKTERFSIEWFGLTVAEKEEIDLIFDDLGTSQPFFVQLDSNPNLGFSGRKEKYVRYVKFERAPTWALESPKNFTCSMTLLEEI